MIIKIKPIIFTEFPSNSFKKVQWENETHGFNIEFDPNKISYTIFHHGEIILVCKTLEIAVKFCHDIISQYIGETIDSINIQF